MITIIDWPPFVLVGLLALLGMPAPTSPFSWSPLWRPNSLSSRRHSTILVSARMRQKGSDIDDALLHFQFDSRMMNTTNVQSSSSHQQLPFMMDVDFLEAGFVSHQSLLNSMTTREQQHHADHHNLNHLELTSPSRSKVTTSEETNDCPQGITSPTIVPPTTTSSSTTITTATTARSILPILSDTWKARLLLLLSAALYGTNFTVVKNLDEIMPVGISSTLRFGFAALVMFPMLIAPLSDEFEVLAKERRRSRTTRESEEKSVASSVSTDYGRIQNAFQFLEEPSRLGAGLAGMEIGLYNSIGYIAQAVGLRTTTASKSAFICSMAVVTVPILDYIWGKQLLRRQIIGACLAAFGVFALELGGQQTTISDGDVMSLIQPLVFGLGFWKMEAAMEKYPTEAGRLAAAQLLTVFLVSLSYLMCWSPMAVAGGEDSLPDVCNVIPNASEIIAWLHDPYIMGMFIWTGIVTTAFTIYMETLALKTLSAAETTLIFSTEPLFGAAFAAIVANEYFGFHDAIGAVFIIAGCLVSGLDVGKFLGGRQTASSVETTLAKK